MEEDRLLKQVLFGEVEGADRQDRPTRGEYERYGKDLLGRAKMATNGTVSDGTKW